MLDWLSNQSKLMIETNTLINNSQHIKRITTRIALSTDVRRNHHFRRKYQAITNAVVTNAVALLVCLDFHRPVSAHQLDWNFINSRSATPPSSNLTLFLARTVASSCPTGQTNCTSSKLTIQLIDLVPWVILLILGLLITWEIFKIFNSTYS
jgi:hypothetical protein